MTSTDCWKSELQKTKRTDNSMSKTTERNHMVLEAKSSSRRTNHFINQIKRSTQSSWRSLKRYCNLWLPSHISVWWREPDHRPLWSVFASSLTQALWQGSQQKNHANKNLVGCQSRVFPDIFPCGHITFFFWQNFADKGDRLVICMFKPKTVKLTVNACLTLA